MLRADVQYPSDVGDLGLVRSKATSRGWLAGINGMSHVLTLAQDDADVDDADLCALLGAVDR